MSMNFTLLKVGKSPGNRTPPLLLCLQADPVFLFVLLRLRSPAQI